MALRANDPMMLANSVEKPNLRENYNQSTGHRPGGHNQPSALEAPPLPAQTMSNFVDLSQDNVITYDRYMWSTSYDRNAANGDFIRGDIPIIPNVDCNNKWFNTALQFRPNKAIQTRRDGSYGWCHRHNFSTDRLIGYAISWWFFEHRGQ